MKNSMGIIIVTGFLLVLFFAWVASSRQNEATKQADRAATAQAEVLVSGQIK